MHRSRTAALAVAACALGLATTAADGLAADGSTIRQRVATGATWLAGTQTNTGSYGTGFGANLVPSALAAAGRNAADLTNGGPSSQDYLQTTLTSSALTAPTSASDPASQVGIIEQSVLQGYSAGLDPARIAANQNLAAQLAGYYDDGYFAAQIGQFDTDARSTNYAIFGALALNRLSAPQFLIDRTVAAIRANQHTDGGWDYPYAPTDADKQAASGTDMTGAGIAALCLSGVSADDSAVRRGIDLLKRRLVTSGTNEGGFDNTFGIPNNPADADSTGNAVSGLNACGVDPQSAAFQGLNNRTPIDFLLSLQKTANPNLGAFTYNLPNSQTANKGASQDALRALAGGTFSAEPPARVDPSLSPTRAVDPVADGTPVPIALAVDDGSGGVSFCRVSVPSGSSLATLLATAGSESSPAGCATGGEFTGGQLSKLNGQTGTWAFSTGGGEQVAANQAVRFGDFVALRRTSNAVPATAGTSTPPAAVPAAVQARTTPAGVASSSLKVSAKKRVVSVSLSCARDNRSCQGSVYIVYGKRTLGRRAFTIAGGKTTKLNVKLSTSSLKRFGKKARKVKVNTFSRDGAGIASSSSRTVTLTPTK